VISTVDFITPPVDDPYWFGQVAAANSISDVYSMGGRPTTALNLVLFPAKHLDIGVLKEILRGGHDKVVEAGASLVGGHSVDDEEPKYGLAVDGVVHPDRILRNSGSRTGDVLILTKPLGAGVLFNAVRSGKMPFREVEENVLPTVAALNGPAIAALSETTIHACTDITGFGIAGHLLEVALGSTARVVLHYDRLQFYPGAREMYEKGETTGSNKPNRLMTAEKMEVRRKLTDSQMELLFDPQTSGGLLLSIPDEQADDAERLIIAAGVAAYRIGEIVDGEPGITVV